jgi:DNA primase catalytic subunit
MAPWKNEASSGVKFCELEFDMVKHETMGLYFPSESYSGLKVVYSGGLYIHVLDQKAYQLTVNERLDLARKVKKAGFHIDDWVTSGEFRLIRLPYSLNGLVSRIALPLRKDELESFDAVHDKRCLPKFLGKEAIS